MKKSIIALALVATSAIAFTAPAYSYGTQGSSDGNQWSFNDWNNNNNNNWDNNNNNWDNNNNNWDNNNNNNNHNNHNNHNNNNNNHNNHNNNGNSVPEPGTLALLGAGLVGMVALRRRKSS